MSDTDTISVPWPPAPLGETGWRRRLEDLAQRAESLIGQPCSLQDTATLALELFGLVWPVIGAPETVAATCRASLLVGPPGIVAASPASDQLAEVHTRLDEIWQQAQSSPAAGVVSLPVPVLNEVRPDARRRMGRPRKPAPADAEPWCNCIEPVTPEPEPVVITPDPPAPAPAPARPLRPASERCAPRPAPPTPAAEPEVIELLELEPLPEVIVPEPIAVHMKPPADWWSSAEVAELLGLSTSQVSRRRCTGHLGEPETGWIRCGKAHYFAPSIVEAAADARNKKTAPAEVQAL